MLGVLTEAIPSELDLLTYDDKHLDVLAQERDIVAEPLLLNVVDLLSGLDDLILDLLEHRIPQWATRILPPPDCGIVSFLSDFLAVLCDHVLTNLGAYVARGHLVLDLFLVEFARLLGLGLAGLAQLGVDLHAEVASMSPRYGLRSGEQTLELLTGFGFFALGALLVHDVSSLNRIENHIPTFFFIFDGASRKAVLSSIPIVHLVQRLKALRTLACKDILHYCLRDFGNTQLRQYEVFAENIPTFSLLYIYLFKTVFIYRHVCGQVGFASVGGGLRLPTSCPCRVCAMTAKILSYFGTSPQHVTKDCPDS